jgi:hypothetical protein
VTVVLKIIKWFKIYRPESFFHRSYTFCLYFFSIPDFKVKVDEGQPLQAPCKNYLMTILVSSSIQGNIITTVSRDCRFNYYSSSNYVLLLLR